MCGRLKEAKGIGTPAAGTEIIKELSRSMVPRLTVRLLGDAINNGSMMAMRSTTFRRYCSTAP